MADVGRSRGPDRDALAFLAGGGEMGERIRAFDWSQTALGRPESWPQSLRSAVSILLPSRAQIVLFWGRDLVTLYNDAYRPVYGAKHPRVLGLPAWEAWAELWHAGLKELIEGVVDTGVAFWASDLPFSLERFGYPEETFFDVSYDPVRDETGRVGGVFCIVSETTARVVGARRLRTLKELGDRTNAVARSAIEACQVAAEILGANRHDLPFNLVYLLDADGRKARLAGAAGLAAGASAAPPEIDPGAADGRASPWPLGAVVDSGRSQVVTGLDRLGALPGDVWPEPAHTAVVLPIRQSGQDRLAGFLVAGVSPRRPLDEEYHGFLDLVATQVATAVANARAFAEEKRRAEALAELDQAKTAFFSNVSHEFRTPLTLMLGPVEELLGRSDTDLAPAAREPLEVVHRNGLRLLRLVNTLLDFSRIEAGRGRASFQPTDLAALTADLASSFRSACERAGLRLVVDCLALPEPVFVDREMWEKVVLNLLSNAFKFTFEGEIAVSLRQVGGAAEARFRDTGTGIPAGEMPRLFERFHRVQNARGRTYEGSGIGLALVQELVRLHGGAIAVDSVAGRGTTFTVTLPLGSAHLPPDQIRQEGDLAAFGQGAGPYVEEALRWLPDGGPASDEGRAEGPGGEEPPPADRPPQPGQERPRVLVADDNADMRQYVTRLLAGPYRVEAVADGEAALAAVRERRPDLVLSDVMMPRLGGFGLLQALRGDPGTRDLPVILLSARAGEESRVEGFTASADDYLVKPFSARELLARVGATLQLARLRRETEETLRDTDRRKDEFLATLAHELRNPLAPLRNGLQVIKLAPDDGERVEQARAMMERQLGQMVRLIDDLLDVSRITSGKFELRRERAELAPIVEQALETSRPLIEAGGHRLTVTLPPDPIAVDADVTRLAQVFSNLLNNAAKYTERGGHVTLAVERQGEDAVVVSVRDTGVGIPAPMLPRIFDLFTQVERSPDKSQGGLGIGLSLVKGLVERHGGSVEARSAGHGQGSELVVRLPMLPPLAEQPPGETRAVPPAVRRRILVVDDHRDAAGSLALMLEMMGHETRTAGNGLEALDTAAAFGPDVILLDIGMPKLNGHDTARSLRQQPWGRATVLVALTGWGQEEDRRRSREAGFDFHLVKPVEPEVLEKLLAGLDIPAAPLRR